MIILSWASPIVNGAPLYFTIMATRLSLFTPPSSQDNKQWPHGHVHWSFHSWWIIKVPGTIDDVGHVLDQLVKP
ncbi:hypothetical protein TNCV_3976961 [Trichonephila clavipes]|nr:hypothetical protein TNCV_3976961 [Trichonephila clavipes]